MLPVLAHLRVQCTIGRLDRMEPCVLRLRPVGEEQWSAPAHLRGLPGWAR
jgi:hypothetical protein